jgi:hypothetical protein
MDKTDIAHASNQYVENGNTIDSNTTENREVFSG